MSDSDRERVVQKLNAAVGEGRITLAEFEERVAGVLASRTFGEVEQYLADLPQPPGPPVRDVIELKSMASTLSRTGAWTVPRRLIVRNSAGSVKLDFTDAVISFPVVEIQLDVLAGTTTLVLPVGATADATEVHTMAGSLKIRQQIGEHGGDIHFVVAGRQRMGDLVIRHQYRFWRWRW